MALAALPSDQRLVVFEGADAQAAREHHGACSEVGRRQPLSAITKAAINEGIDRRDATSFQAKNFLTTMRGLFEWAHGKDLVSVDPTAGVKVIKPKTNGFPVWSEEDIENFEARWPLATRQRVMLDVFPLHRAPPR